MDQSPLTPHYPDVVSRANVASKFLYLTTISIKIYIYHFFRRIKTSR